MCSDRIEQKVEKVFTNSCGSRVEAVLYRKVDPIGVTLGYIMHKVFEGNKFYDSDPEALLKLLQETSL